MVVIDNQIPNKSGLEFPKNCKSQYELHYYITIDSKAQMVFQGIAKANVNSTSRFVFYLEFVSIDKVVCFKRIELTTT